MDTESGPTPRDWSDEVAHAEGPEGRFAYRPHQVVVRGEARRAIEELYPGLEPEPDGDGSFLFTLPPNADVLRLVADLSDDGYRAEPNYVLFAHTMQANPLYGNPLYGTPLWGNPLYGNPLYFDQYQMTGIRPSTARPAPEPTPGPLAWAPAKARQRPSIIVLDTGLADAAYRPPFLGFLGGTTQPADQDKPDEDGDPYQALDAVAGHGTFVAGVIERMIPGRRLALGRVLSTFGDTDGWKVGKRLTDLVNSGISGPGGVLKADSHTIVNLSFGGPAAGLRPGEMWHLARAVRRVQDQGAVVVASAGNDASPRRCYPACLPGVIGVAALSANGPSAFTNYGPWVRACAPGTNLVSSFFRGFNGPVSIGPIDPDKFEGWARWSGTSFAAPVVVAALAREMVRPPGCTAVEAVERVIDAPGLLSLPLLGTVVNIV